MAEEKQRDAKILAALAFQANSSSDSTEAELSDPTITVGDDAEKEVLDVYSEVNVDDVEKGKLIAAAAKSDDEKAEQPPPSQPIKRRLVKPKPQIRRSSITEPGGTEPEQIAERLEKRREERVPVTLAARVRFLKECRSIARAKEYGKPRVSRQDIIDFRGRAQEEFYSGKGFFNNNLFRTLGIRSNAEGLAHILDRAVWLFENEDVATGRWLYYQDFVFDHTRIESRWPPMRHDVGMAALVVLLYYILTPVLFCWVMPMSNICSSDGSSQYDGWISAIYFASTTLSTVGYGDLTVDQEPKIRSFVGSMYMLVAMIVAVVAFTSIAQSSFRPMEVFFQRLFDRFTPNDEKDMFLYERIRRIRFVTIAELLVALFSYIMIGVFCSQGVVAYDRYHYPDEQKEEGSDWSWMTSFYWAIQTVTTIGYGDLAQPSNLRYFKIIYLMICTVLVGNVLGRIGGLKYELKDIRRKHFWDRRPLTKRMVDEMQANVHDEKLDQWEYLVASLVILGKITSEDIKPIMDKFRTHAGPKGYILAEDDIEEEMLNEDSEGDDDIHRSQFL